MQYANNIEQTVQTAAINPTALQELILANENFILRCVASVTHRFATRSDDEWSVALSAFCHAVKSYQPDRGNFHSFAELVIKRRLLDYLRVNSRFDNEISVPPECFDEPPDEDADQPALQAAILSKVAHEDDNSLQQEIELLGEILQKYGFDFMALADCSPHADKTKRATAVAVATLLRSSILLGDMRISRQLPIAAIVTATGLPRKILERHRKYIIAAAEILSGEFYGLAEYMGYIREELKR